MNHQDESSLQGRLERLVDGELPPDEYQRLLAALEEEPGGWRQCALAFLEGQALAEEMRPLRTSVEVRGGDAAPRPSTAWDKATMLLAVAASFMVALGLGLAAPKFLPFGGQEGIADGNINQQPPAFVGEDSANSGAAQNMVRYVGDVRLLVDGATEGGQVPVYEVGQDVTRYLADEAPALGPEMVELLRQHGYDVRQDQQFFPAPLGDGRQLIVPIEGYQITPVSRRY